MLGWFVKLEPLNNTEQVPNDNKTKHCQAPSKFFSSIKPWIEVSARVVTITGLPKIGGMVNQVIKGEVGKSAKGDKVKIEHKLGKYEEICDWFIISCLYILNIPW